LTTLLKHGKRHKRCLSGRNQGLHSFLNEEYTVEQKANKLSLNAQLTTCILTVTKRSV
jgi:hypothetical protein